MSTETSARPIMSRPVVVPGAVATSLDEITAALRARDLDPARAARARSLAQATQVATRYLSRPISDLLDPDGDTRNGLGWVSDTLFELTGRAARQALDQEEISPRQVDVLVVASVSGWMMPGIAEHLGDALGLRPEVRRIACTQSGCAGSAVALQRAAEQVALNRDATVLVVVADIGSAAIQPCLADDSDFIFTALLGDGAAAWIVRDSRRAAGPGLGLGVPWSYLLPGSQDRYRFWVEAGGARFASTRNAPEAVSQIAPHLQTWYQDQSLGQDLRIVAAHPGGPAIMRNLAEALKLDEAQLARSRQSLAEYGNMGAVSLADVLARHFDGGLTAGDAGLIIGLGPGVQCEALTCWWQD
jgi:predicted naringenin-chalcone synthase